jgi:hypothetical protein
MDIPLRLFAFLLPTLPWGRVLVDSIIESIPEPNFG